MTTTTSLTSAPVVGLSNGLRVMNFSSPHPFTFEDGTVLPACDEARSRALSMDREDEESAWAGPLFNVTGSITAVKPVFRLNAETLAALEAAEESWDVDVVLVPFPLLQAVRAEGHEAKFTKIATVIMADRISKAAAIDKFGR